MLVEPSVAEMNPDQVQGHDKVAADGPLFVYHAPLLK